MKNKTPFPIHQLMIACICLFALSSCGDLEQELFLNKDGSGRLETSMDVGELLGIGRSLENMGSDIDSVTDDFTIDTFTIQPEDEAKDAMQLFMEKVTDPAYDKNVDTTFTLYDAMPDSAKVSDPNPEMSKKINLRVQSPANSGDLKIGVIMNFRNVVELRDQIRYLQDLEKVSSVSGSAGLPIDSQTFLVFDTDMKAGWIKVDTIQYEDVAVGFGLNQDSTKSSEDEAMMEMMFGNSKIKSVIHVPGEVISCTNKDAILTKDNKVIVEQSFLEAMKAKRFNGFTIHFTPQK